MAHPQPYEAWTALDFAWLEVCDALLRLPGHSPGADAEEAWCQAHGLPVFDSLDPLVAWIRGRAAR